MHWSIRSTGSKTCLLTTVLLLAMTSGPARAAGDVDWANLKPETVLNAISVFAADPGSAKNDAVISVIIKFADASPNVTVTVDSGFFPWVDRKPEIEKRDLLLTAFIAGNIRPQLEKQVKKDHPIEGIQLMCKVYVALRKKKTIPSIPELDKWSKLDKAGIAKLIPKIQNKKEPYVPIGSSVPRDPAR